MQDRISIKSQRSTLMRFKELLRNLEYLESLGEGDTCKLNIEFATPFSLLPLVSLINQKSIFCEESANSYLKTIHFPDGKKELEKICKGTYMPIIRLSLEGISDSDERSMKLNALHEGFLNILKSNIKDPKFVQRVTKGTFGLLLGELIDNINEHSLAKNIYIFISVLERK
jgi:hypothetical protein